MDKVIFSIIGYVVGFMYNYFTSGRTEGVQGIIPNIEFSFGSKNIIIHHWLTQALVLGAVLIIETKYSFIPRLLLYLMVGFLLGGINQGLLYSDWYKFIR